MKSVFSHTSRLVLLAFLLAGVCLAQDTPTAAPTPKPGSREQAEGILKKAIQTLGGDKYLSVKTQIGRGKYSIIQDGGVVSFQTFIDVIVFPNKERTDFKGGTGKSIQANVGNTGWVFDGGQELVKVQGQDQVEGWQRGMRTSLDYLLRGHWKGDAELSYVGKRAATLGKRNDVVKLTYSDGLVIEFEFATEDALPQKSVYKHTNDANEEVKEEDRYAQFIDVAGIKTPFIVDRFTNGNQTSRINYQSVDFNKPIPDAVFAKPNGPKDVKEMKL